MQLKNIVDLGTLQKQVQNSFLFSEIGADTAEERPFFKRKTIGRIWQILDDEPLGRGRSPPSVLRAREGRQD